MRIGTVISMENHCRTILTDSPTSSAIIKYIISCCGYIKQSRITASKVQVVRKHSVNDSAPLCHQDYSKL